VGFSKSIISAIRGIDYSQHQASISLCSIKNGQTDDKNVSSKTDKEINLKREIHQRKSISLERTPQKSHKIEIRDSDKKRTQSVHSLNSVDSYTDKRPVNKRHIDKSPVKRPANRHPSLSSTTPSYESCDRPKISFAICSSALYSCTNSDLKTLKGLIKEYPDLVDYAYPFCYKLTCLHIAAKAGDTIVASYLVDQGADLNAKDDNWNTPLHLAAKANKYEMCLYLKKKGADTTLIDSSGLTFADYLSIEGKQMLFQGQMIFTDESENHRSRYGSQNTLNRSSFRAPLSRMRDFLKL